MSFFFGWGSNNSNNKEDKNASQNSNLNNNEGGSPRETPPQSTNVNSSNGATNVNDLREQQAQVLLQSGITAYDNGDLDSALNFYTECIQLYMEIYRTEPEGSARKADFYALMEVNLMEAEKIKAQIRERDEAAGKPTITNDPKPANNNPTSGSSNKAVPKTSRRDPSTKPLPLPDHYDYTAGRRPLGGTPINAQPNPTRKTTVANPTSSASNTTPGGAVVKRAGSGGSTSGKAEATTAASSSNKSNEYSAQIMEEILDKSPGVHWNDIAGLSFAKQTLQEAVILPNLRPDLFTGLRSPPKGVLLFGPPGTGKTLLAKAVATESGFVFFSISASSVTSKYLGEGEKLIKALFELAREKQPAVIFIDEIDSLMSARKDNEHEASRRLKTEFMTQLDGAASSGEDRILVMGATNLPWDIDEAVLRRLPKRIYVPLPDEESRKALITHLLAKQGPSASHPFSARDLNKVVAMTEGYSGSDLAAVCHEAALGPIRELNPTLLKTIKAEEVRPIHVKDFENALRIIRPSVSGESLKVFQRWAEQFGVTR